MTTEWKNAFICSSMRASFCLSLTQPMLELLCATADGVHWDRTLHFPAFGNAKRDSWAPTETALIRKGLIEKVPKSLRKIGVADEIETDRLRLTPAGEKIVELLRVVGLFVEADATSLKRERKR